MFNIDDIIRALEAIKATGVNEVDISSSNENFATERGVRPIFCTFESESMDCTVQRNAAILPAPKVTVTTRTILK